MTKESPRVVGYAAIVVVLAAASLVLALRYPPGLPLDKASTMALLVTMCVVGLQLMVRRLAPSVDVSVDFIVQLATLALLGPAAAMVVAGAASLLDLRPSRLVVRIFNVALDVVSVGAGALAFIAAGGRPQLGTHESAQQLLLHVGLPMMAANITMLLVSCSLVAGVVALDDAVPYREVLSGMLRSLIVLYSGYGLFGLLLVVLWEPAEVGPLAAVLVLAPMLIARWAFAQYAEQHAAHERTVAALVSAVEAKDRYTRGHSERVARASVLIGRTVGLSQQRTSSLQFAGMLHDVGKLGVPTRVLQKSGALTDDEFVAIARHPLRGLEMVREIEFLGEALQGILHHHERLDGRGYPLGLAGNDIPEFARIIAVADAFDSMTSTRSYRHARSVEQAVEELESCTGTQFDPRFVRALRQALARTDWQPVTTGAVTADGGPSGGTGLLGARSADDTVDHDDPGFAVPTEPVRRDVADTWEGMAGTADADPAPSRTARPGARRRPGGVARAPRRRP